MQADRIEVGDTVECIKKSDFGYPGIPGQTFVVSKIEYGSLFFDGYPQEPGNGSMKDRFKLLKKKGADNMNKFKVGDRVKVISNVSSHSFLIGEVVVITFISGNCHTCQGSNDHWYLRAEELELMPEYEDEWHLNTGQEIPDDADKAWNSDKTSVVAFRYVKKPLVRTFTREVVLNSASFYINSPGASYNTHKIVVTSTDNDITDITWEKI